LYGAVELGRQSRRFEPSRGNSMATTALSIICIFPHGTEPIAMVSRILADSDSPESSSQLSPEIDHNHDAAAVDSENVQVRFDNRIRSWKLVKVAGVVTLYFR
jgi:hypothetical protein